MPYQQIKDPQTGEVREVYVAPPRPAAKPAAKPAAAPQQSNVNPLLQFIANTPVGLLLQAGGSSIGTGLDVLQRGRSIPEALGASNEAYARALEGPGANKATLRVITNATRNFLQEASDLVTADIPAAFGDKAIKPTSKEMPDAPFLGFLPPLAKAKSSGPAEDLATGIAQVAIELFPATKAVGLAGAGLKALPGAARVAKTTDKAVDAYQAAKAAQITKLTPKLQKPVTVAVGGVEAVASNLVGKGAATGALIDFAGFDQNEGRLYDLADKFKEKLTGTPLEYPFLDYLKSKPGDVGVEGRLKNAVEGVFVGSTVEFLMRAFRAGKYVERLRNATPEERPTAAAVAAEAANDLKQVMTQQGTDAAEQVRALNTLQDIGRGVEVPSPAAAPVAREADEVAVSATEAAVPPAVAAPEPRAQVKLTATQRRELETSNSTLMGEIGVDLKQGLTRPQLEALEQSIRSDYALPGQGGIDEVSAATRRSMIKLADKFRKAADELPAEQAPVAPAATPLDQAVTPQAVAPVARVADEVAVPATDAAVPPAAAAPAPAAAPPDIQARIAALGPEPELPTPPQVTRPEQQADPQGFGVVSDVDAAARETYEAQLKAYNDYYAQRDVIEAEAVAPPAAVAGPTQQEIQQLDDLLARAASNLPLEQRIALRDQQLAQKYGTGSPDEPPAPPAPPAPPTLVQAPVLDDDWARRFVEQIKANRAAIDAGEMTTDDLLANNIQKIVSPSGATTYQPVQPQAMVESYRSLSDIVSRSDATGIRTMTDEQIVTETALWLKNNKYSTQAVFQNLRRLSGPLSAYKENLVAMRAMAMVVDEANKGAGLAANRWLNSAVDEAADMGQLTAELLVHAAKAYRANSAFVSVTRPLGQLLRSTQIPRPEPGSVPFKDGDTAAVANAELLPPGKNISADFEKELAKDQEDLIANTIGVKLSPDTREAIIANDYSNPKVLAELEELARSMSQSALTPGYSLGFWRQLGKVTNIGANGLMLYRVSQLLSSGATFWSSLIGSAFRTAYLPLVQVSGDVAGGNMQMVPTSLMLYGQYVQNLHGALRLGIESFKVGRGLFDLDRTQVDYFDRLAKQDANTEAVNANVSPSWNINTLPWLSVQDKSIWAIAQKWSWQLLNLSTRGQMSIDTAFKSLVGTSFEYVRNIQPGYNHAARQGLVGDDAWRFAHDYAQAAVDRKLQDVVIDGKTILDGVMDGPHAMTAARWATFTDDIWANMEPRTMQRGMELANAKNLEGEKAEAYAQEYVNAGKGFFGEQLSEIPGISRTFSVVPAFWQRGLESPAAPLFSLINAFNRSPGDIIKAAVRSTPLAPLTDTWVRDVFSEDAMTRSRARGEVAMGATVLTSLSVAMTHGAVEFTGGGPFHPDAKRKWTEQLGKQPYSMRFRTGKDENGNTTYTPWISHRALEPFSSLIGAMADYQELANKVSEESANRMGSAIVVDLLTAVAAGQLSKTYFQGFAQLVEALMGFEEIDIGFNRRDPFARYIESQAATFVPYSSALNAARRLVDPIAREVEPSNNPDIAMRLFEETVSVIKSRTPGWSESLPPKRNWITGDPIVLSGVWGDAFVPTDHPWLASFLQLGPQSSFSVKRDPGIPVLREMGQLAGLGSSFVGPRATDFTNGGTIKENRLSPVEFEQYILAVSRTPDQFGRTLLQALDEEIKSDLYQQSPQGRPSEQVKSLRVAALNTVISKFLALGRETFLTGPYGVRLMENKDYSEGANRDVQFRLKYGQEIDPRSFIEALR